MCNFSAAGTNLSTNGNAVNAASERQINDRLFMSVILLLSRAAFNVRIGFISVRGIPGIVVLHYPLISVWVIVSLLTKNTKYISVYEEENLFNEAKTSFIPRSRNLAAPKRSRTWLSGSHRYLSARPLIVTCMILSAMISSHTANHAGVSGAYPVAVL